MTGRDFGRCCLVLALFATIPGPPAFALGTAFTYQGQLQQGGAPTNGSCDFQFSLWDELGSGAPPTGGDQIGSTQTKSSVNVNNGVFTVPLDFGAAAFSSASDRWLHIAVRCPAGSGSYQALEPRQPLTPAPFALFANAIADGSVSSGKLALGAVTTPQLANESVTAEKIADGNIAANDLANGAVTTAKIGDGQVTSAKLAPGAVSTSQLANNAVTAAQIADGTVTSAKIANNTIADSDIDATKVQRRVTATCAAATALNQVNVDGTVGCVTVGDITAVTAGGGLSGGGTSGNATLNVAVPLALSGAVAPGAVISATNTGVGVLGTSAQSFGVHGISEAGGTDAVRGTANGSGGNGVHGIANNGSNAFGVYGESANGYGVFARSVNNTAVNAASTAGVGVLGTSTESAGVHGMAEADFEDGVRGTASGAAGNGVHGIANNGATAYGVFGQSTAGVGVRGHGMQRTGVSGESEGVGSQADGVLGTALGVNGNGVHGVANNGTGAYAVWGESTSGFAGYFHGKVSVTGTLTKGGGSFKIDHPLDPANKYLSHSFVESPDMKNIYDGIAVLDGDGQAEVELPDWFEALNRDFRYQLTCLGAFAPVYVAAEIHDNRFRIAGGTPGQKISWLVTGIRQDAYANAHRIVVEEDKPAPEAGRYLHPVEHGMPESLSVSAAKDSASTKE